MEEGAEPRGQHPAHTVHVHVHISVLVCSALKSRSVEELRWFQQVLVGRFLVGPAGPAGPSVCLTVCPSVCQQQRKLSLKQEDQECVRTLRLRDEAAAQVQLDSRVFVCVFLRVCMRVCGLTWLPRLPTELEDHHPGGSGFPPAGASEVSALPDSQEAAVRSLPASVLTSSPGERPLAEPPQAADSSSSIFPSCRPCLRCC